MAAQFDRATLRAAVEEKFVIGQLDWPSGYFVRVDAESIEDPRMIVLETNRKGGKRAIAKIRAAVVAAWATEDGMAVVESESERFPYPNLKLELVSELDAVVIDSVSIWLDPS